LVILYPATDSDVVTIRGYRENDQTQNHESTAEPHDDGDPRLAQPLPAQLVGSVAQQQDSAESRKDVASPSLEAVVQLSPVRIPHLVWKTGQCHLLHDSLQTPELVQLPLAAGTSNQVSVKCG